MYKKITISESQFTGQHEELSVQCVCGRQLKCATVRACVPKNRRNSQSTDVLANIKKASFQVAMRGFFIMLAISLHSVFEGIAMGLRTKASIVWYLCFAIAVHKFIIAFCIGLQVNLIIIGPQKNTWPKIIFKGQTISKANYSVLNSSKKQTILSNSIS
jgi:zinc transporter ZupT